MTARNYSDQIKQSFPIFAILIASLVIRLTLFTGMIRSDDFQYAHAAFELANGYTNLQAWAGNVRVGFYGPVAILYFVFGASNVTTLIWPVFCSMLSIVFIYGIGRLLWDEAAGLLGALTWALLPYDIFLATDLLPDGAQSAFDAGVVFFLLLGEKTQNKKKYLYYAISFLMMVWAILIKEPSVIVLFFVLCYILYKIIDRYQEQIKKIKPVKWFVEKPVVAFIIGFVLFCLFFSWYAAQQPNLRHFITMLTNTASNLAKLITEHLAYRHLSILFIIAFSSLLLSRDEKKSKIYILMWFSVIYLYYEWGTISTKPIFYNTIDYYTDARYALFIFTPISVFTGRYLSQSISLRTSRIAVLLISMITILVSLLLWMFPSSISEAVQSISAQSINFFILLSIASPLIFHAKIRSIFKNICLMILLSLFLLSTFNVTHTLLNLYNDLRYPMENIQKISQYLVNQPEAPIYVISKQNALSLNYFSDFELGYNDFGENREGQMINIIDYSEIIGIQHGYLVIDGSDSGSSIPSGWKQKMEFQHIIKENEKASGVSHMLYIY